MHVEMWLPWKRDMSRIELTLTKCIQLISLPKVWVLKFKVNKRFCRSGFHKHLNANDFKIDKWLPQMMSKVRMFCTLDEFGFFWPLHIFGGAWGDLQSKTAKAK